MTTDNGRPNLAILKGGKLTSKEFGALSLQAKIDYLHHLRGAVKLRTILEDPMPEKLVRSLPKVDVYQILHDLGSEESLEILQLASPVQIRFILDWELWEEWSISVERTLEWLELLLVDEERAIEIISRMDQELLLVFLKKTIAVGGGLGDIINSEDYQLEWDHTFDEMYYIKFLDSRHNELVLRFLDLIYRQNHQLYRSLMQGVENELLSELEELAGQFRQNRLADEGFPSTHDAAALYTRVSPENFTPAVDKVNIPTSADISPFPAIPDDEASLLSRAFAAADSPALRQEFHHLTNGAMVAEGVTPADHEKMRPVLERVGSYLNIALEFLCDNESEGAAILTGEHLKRLFSLGYSLLAQLQERARKLESDNYAAGKVLTGLRMRRPLFYRGLDPDTVDDYREFAGMEDMRTMDRFLRGLETA
ncbi:MAG TPA: DUF6178 family protein [Geobacteraceae bacterium]|nr:DUF6178 family protein [Geobacteraceae bacterium]